MFVVLVVFLMVPFLFICLICIYCNTTVKDFRKDANAAVENLRHDAKATVNDLRHDAKATVEGFEGDVNTATKGVFDGVLDWMPRLFKKSSSNSIVALMPSKSKASDAYSMVSQEDVPFGII